MTMPAKIWMRSLSPSTTRVWTRTPSPTRNSVTSDLSWSFSMASMMRFMAALSSGRSMSADAPRTQLPKRVSCYRKDRRYNARSAAPVVQLDRATASGAVGCAFEPRRAHSDPEWHLAQRCDSAEQILFACHAGDLVADLSVFENEQRRDRTNVEFEREVLVLVDVHLADGKATVFLTRDLIDQRRDQFARAAPFRPKIDKHRLVILVDFAVEIRLRERDGN